MIRIWMIEAETAEELASFVSLMNGTPETITTPSVLPSVEDLVTFWNRLGSEPQRRVFKIMIAYPEAVPIDLLKGEGYALPGVLGGLAKNAIGFIWKECVVLREGCYHLNDNFKKRSIEALQQCGIGLE